MKNYILFIILLFSISTKSQTLKDLEKTDKNYSDCIDKSMCSGCCTRDYSETVDKLLNETYKSLLAKAKNDKEKESIKVDQRKWLANRKFAYAKILKDLEKESEVKYKDFGTMDKDLLLIGQTSYQYERVEYLIKKLNK